MGVIARLFQPDDERQLIGWLFLRALALIYFAAFLSLGVQITGLAGPTGILPFQEALDEASRQYGGMAWLHLPTLFWLDSSDAALLGATISGCVVSMLLLFNILPLASLIVLFALYLSLTHAGQIFLNFQWDYLLLESGFLAILWRWHPNRLVVLLFHWLLFRLRFMSGLSKIVSGDPTWAGLTTLDYYFETQPLPQMGAWYAHQLPGWLLQTGTAFTLFVELLVPFFIFLPRRFRLFAAGATVLMQLLILTTSNHNFFNLLTIVLCLFLLDDGVVRRVRGWIKTPLSIPLPHRRPAIVVSSLAAVLIFSSSLPLLYRMATGDPLPDPLHRWTVNVRRFGLGNAYHVFPVMQTERVELEVEGSQDGLEWRPYRFLWKPQALDHAPSFIVPHQPRLDWMLWFVPTQHPMQLYWFDRFLRRLWEGASSVEQLLAARPFPIGPPRYLRVTAYRYQFTTSAERDENGQWWKREYLGIFPQIPPRRP